MLCTGRSDVKPDSRCRSGSEAQVLTGVKHNANLLQSAVAAIIPKEPFLTVEDRVGFVTGVMVPLPFAGADDWIGRMALPAGDAVAGAGEADLGVGLIAEANVEHQIRIPAPLDLAGRDFVFLPVKGGVWGEDGVSRVFGPAATVRTGSIADRVGLVLLATGIPEAEEPSLRVPQHVRAHDGNLLPRLLRRQHRAVTHALPGGAVETSGVTDGRMAFGLASVPEVVAILTFQDDRAVDVVLPAGLLPGAEDDSGWLAPMEAVPAPAGLLPGAEDDSGWLAPMEAVPAFDQGHARLWPPGEPHAVQFAFLQD